jgi:hypothetical protein
MPAAKYKFLEQQAYDFVIANTANDTAVGTLRVKPSTILWKPKGAKGKTPWFSVGLDDFAKWAMEQKYKVNK